MTTNFINISSNSPTKQLGDIQNLDNKIYNHYNIAKKIAFTAGVVSVIFITTLILGHYVHCLQMLYTSKIFLLAKTFTGIGILSTLASATAATNIYFNNKILLKKQKESFSNLKLKKNQIKSLIKAYKAETNPNKKQYIQNALEVERLDLIELTNQESNMAMSEEYTRIIQLIDTAIPSMIL